MIPSGSKPLQSCTVYHMPYFSGRESSSFGHSNIIVYLTSLIDSAVMFTIAFGLETLVFSRQTWAKLSVGIALAVMILLILWCAWTGVAARTCFSTSSGVNLLKRWLVDSTGGLRGKIPEPRPGVGEGKGGDGQSKSGKFYKSGTLTLREAFDFIRRPRRQRGSTASTLVDAKWTESRVSCGPPDSAEVGISETKNGVSECAV